MRRGGAGRAFQDCVFDELVFGTSEGSKLGGGLGMMHSGRVGISKLDTRRGDSMQVRNRPGLTIEPRTMRRIYVFSRLTATLAIATLMNAQGPVFVMAAEFATRDEAVALVKRAVAFIEREGASQAYAEFSRRGGQFHDRDLYITVLGLDGQVLAHGQRTDLIGQNLIAARDPDGKLFIKERSDLARSHPSF